jgi:Zn-dependent protease
VLFLFGGVSNISDEPRDYPREAKMALAGPLMSFVLAAIFIIFWLLVSHYPVVVIKQVTLDVLYYAGLINIILGMFNLIPAFPSDGGRVLHPSLFYLLIVFHG